MNIEITDYRIQQIIHNISDDFRFSSKHEKYSPYFYSVEGTHEVDQKNYSEIVEYLLKAKKKIKEDIAWKQKIIDENSTIKEKKLLIIMKTMEKEYDDLYNYLIKK